MSSAKRRKTGGKVSFADAVTTPEETSSSSSSGSSRSPTQTDPTKVMGKRAQSQKAVAESRAAHFARAPEKLSSTTPTGWATSKGDDAWCGPFSVARRMLEQREAVKKAREEAIANSASGKVEEVGGAEDEYDIYIRTLQWTPYAAAAASPATAAGRSAAPKQPATKRSQIPTLTDLCVKLLAAHLDDIEDDTLRFVSPELLTKFAAEKARARTFNPEVATKLAVPGSEELCFPECSFLDEETLLAALKRCKVGTAMCT